MTMFDNMSQREKVMALAVGGLLPLMLLFFGWNSLSSSLSEKKLTIQNLEREYRELEKQQILGELATVRYANYRKQSLPSDVTTSINQYLLWLQELVEGAGISDFSVDVKNRDAAQQMAGANPRNPVAGRYRFELSRCRCTLEQLTELIYAFNQSNILHRINDLTITANSEGTGARAEPTGDLTVRMTIEVVCMRDADAQREFENDKLATAGKSLEEYHEIVTRRDLFGLPNNAPELDVEYSREFEVGSNVSIDLEASDEDEGQELTYELLEVEGDVTDESASFDKSAVKLVDGHVEMGRLPEGDYSFAVRVTDNGWPNLSTEKEVSVEVFKEEEEVIVEVPMAKDTIVSGIVTFDEETRVWIRIMPEDKTLKLLVGETFELDNKTWKILKIDGRNVDIECAGETLRYEVGSRLSSPLPNAITTSSK